MPYYERQPYIQPVYQLIQEVIDGEIRVPRFQREGTEETWSPEQRGDLLDSLYRAFPVGTILLWSTADKIATRSEVGRFKIPASKEQNRSLRLLLDGHQRISTLVLILGPGLKEGPLDSDPSFRENWIFDLSKPKENIPSRDRFVLLKKGESPSDLQLPLSIVLNRVELNKWVRIQSKISEDSIRLADGLRDRLREYSMPVAVLVTDSLEEATESFKRVNSSGTPMSDLNMTAALAYSEHFDLFEVLDEAATEYLEPIGWKDINQLDVLRVVAGLLRERGETHQHPLKLDIDKLAKTVRSEGKSLIEAAVLAIADAAMFLKQIGVLSPKVLPYSYQLIILAVFLTTDKQQALSKEQVYRWFLLTTYGSVFQGLNSSVYNRALEGLKELSEGKEPDAMRRDLSLRVGPLQRFDFRAARTRACVLVMADWQDANQPGLPAHAALGAVGTDALGVVLSKGRRSCWYHLAIVLPGTALKELRDALTRLSSNDNSAQDDELLSKSGFDPTWTGSVEEILERRRQKIEEKEQRLVEKIGLQWIS